MFTLYDLSIEAQQLQTAMEESEMPEAYIDTIEANDLMIKDKSDGYVTVAKNIEAEIKVLKEEEAELSNRRKAMENSLKRLKDRMMTCMQIAGKTEIQGNKFKVKIVANGGKMPLKIDADKLPDAYKRIILEPDPDKIRASLELGMDVPGAEIGARGHHLSFK